MNGKGEEFFFYFREFHWWKLEPITVSLNLWYSYLVLDCNLWNMWQTYNGIFQFFMFSMP